MSTATVYLYNANQAQQKQLTNALADSTNDASEAISHFVDEYRQQFYYNLNIQFSNFSLDATTKSVVALIFMSTMYGIAENGYSDLEEYFARIQSLTNYVNASAYNQIENIVYVAMGQVDTFGRNDSFTMLATDVPTRANQLYDLLGLGIQSGDERGLPGIAQSFQMMSDYYNALENGANAKLMSSPSVCLNLALANATELESTLSTWDLFTPNPQI